MGAEISWRVDILGEKGPGEAGGLGLSQSGCAVSGYARVEEERHLLPHCWASGCGETFSSEEWASSAVRLGKWRALWMIPSDSEILRMVWEEQVMKRTASLWLACPLAGLRESACVKYCTWWAHARCPGSVRRGLPAAVWGSAGRTFDQHLWADGLIQLVFSFLSLRGTERPCINYQWDVLWVSRLLLGQLQGTTREWSHGFFHCQCL